jgi:DNA-binding transcriptional LysR family regulator
VLPEPDSTLRQEFDRRLRESKITDDWDVVLEVGGWQALLAYVREGLGVGLLPRSVWAAQPRGLLTKGLAPDLAPPNVLRLVCRHDPEHPDQLDLTEAGHKFLEALREAAAPYRQAADE